ncbi:UDP-N-acetylmuramoyl-tripeptide--D-alanyl-D-alanine ligase [Loktanella sp. IMCC34160]|uniref:UDP-N-acetylmuramoyl-tripeptide--D-alanyl-D- alanine ligase n=1 Tax=Loktanella sp. IMCC34160 TaxID=2510646 RepID=UPI00101DB769|nr:UDP-N-acetylmuramoyl-tripeptide--D-alanyl-D-alanine ligase [Loktanella sp. IMCC34160]RYG91804.1 UDP-N-acetylmuramoyl-tripeptide--D-alanyl-D-alanine ligase [Loktanella sp. IMCC34160]
MTALWTAAEAAAATGGRTTGDWAATGVSIDTRTIQPGDLFVALTAARDGHDFVAQALARGAAAAMVTHRPADVAADAPLLIVDDVQSALERLGQAGRARSKARVVAVTGSVGKTSTKEMLREVLSRQGRTHASVASYNNHWGVPLTLARMPVDTDYAVIEIGMNHPGEIAPLSRMTRPHVAMITTVAAAHLEAFGRIEGIASEKASIIAGLDEDGTVVVPADLPENVYGVIDIETYTDGPRRWFGTEDDNPWHLLDVRAGADCTVVRAHLPEVGELVFKLSVAGRHFAVNALGVLAVVDALGADPILAAHDLVHWLPPEGRGTREKVVLDSARSDDWFDLMDDAFNANPTSLSAALEVLAATTPRDGVGRVHKGRRIAVLGDMLELGPDELALHAGIADDPSIQAVDIVHCSGPRMKSLWEALPEGKRGRWTETAEDMAAQSHRLIDAGDVVLVKGSKGSKVSLVVDALRKLGQGRRTSEEGA